MANRIILRRNTDDDFYQIMGRYLSRRNMVKELGFPIWDEDERVWAISLDGSEVVGFFAYNTKKHTTGSLYVLPRFRGRGIGNELSKFIHSYIKENHSPCEVVAMVRPEAIKLYESLGYNKSGQRGQYSKMIISYE